MKKYLVVLFLFICNTVLIYPQVYSTGAQSADIYTIQVNKNGIWNEYPIMSLNSNDFIRLNFDRISEDSFNRLRYRIIHCNADWQQSSMAEIEYLDGFNDNLIEDYASSVNTTVGYTNFMLDIPNRDVRMKIPGNYVVVVYEEDNPNNIMLHACFSVLDPLITLTGNVSGNTLLDSHGRHQQVSFTINHQNLNIRDPFNDLKIFVRQNNRTDNQKTDLKPTFIQSNQLVYEQNRNLIFEAGNEYRRFDIVSSRYNGMKIYALRYERPYYHAFVVPDQIRSGARYLYDEDQNGRFFIRNSDGRESDTDADYFYVNFVLESEEPFLENVYINGAFSEEMFNDKYQMQYDFKDRLYYTTLLLKQGTYNYQYLTQKGDKYTVSDIEGSYFETENEYQILIYHRPSGQRFDSLIGYLNIKR